MTHSLRYVQYRLTFCACCLFGSWPGCLCLAGWLLSAGILLLRVMVTGSSVLSLLENFSHLSCVSWKALAYCGCCLQWLYWLASVLYSLWWSCCLTARALHSEAVFWLHSTLKCCDYVQAVLWPFSLSGCTSGCLGMCINDSCSRNAIHHA